MRPSVEQPMSSNAPARSTGPLAGVRVVDLTSIGMGPFATQMLGDMGADVIKVESEGGDVFRHVTPQRHEGMSHTFLNLNRNKRSIQLDLKSPEGMRTITELIVASDVFVSNVRPAALKRLGLDFDTLKALNPRLIHCGCYGYGEGGPYSGRASVDDVIQAASGAAWLQGCLGAEPAYVNTVIADKVCGLYVSNAITMALYARGSTGVGQAVEVPMFESMVSFLLPEHLAGLTFVPPIGEAGYARLLNKYRKPYRTRDGHIAVVPYTDAQWRRFFELSGHGEVLKDARFASALERSRHIEDLYARVEAIVGERSTAEWTSLLAGADIPFSPINRIEDLVDDPHLVATGFWHRTSHPTEGALLMPGIPIRFSETPGSIRRHAPGLGEHTREIQDELSRHRAPHVPP